MLKNKKAIYILIPVNIIVWCYLGYSIYSGLKGDDVPEISESTKEIKLDELKDSAVYKLSLNYADPFLREGEKSREHKYNNTGSTSSNIAPKNIQVKTPSVVIVKPVTDIKYLGLVKNNSTGISTALVSINGRSHLVKKGDIVEGIGVKSITNTAIELTEGKKSRVVIKD